MIYFTADLHLGHANIIKYCNRPFTSAEEMDKTIINNWNSVIGERDEVYLLGDLALKSIDVVIGYLARMNGKKINLIPGNHDESSWLKKARRNPPYRLEILPPLANLKYMRQHVVLSHYSMRVWNRSHYGAWHLYGHSHGTLPPLPGSLDVGVDANDFMPLSFLEIQEKLNVK